MAKQGYCEQCGTYHDIVPQIAGKVLGSVVLSGLVEEGLETPSRVSRLPSSAAFWGMWPTK